MYWTSLKMSHFEASIVAGLVVFYSVLVSSSLSGGYTNGFRASVRPASFPEHNSKIVEDISTKLATHIKQET